ncbi:hypothetical protein Y032_0039g102 [Ancylostoma ceylanicum]|uniref:Uncharacterized protein n=1 Tax=Ancylostoma ceylanicum TaxID=53326 RepID=A0A016UIG9_9BILA|nr:hypothetical protein Y032_0039g102 [Ancylostoma ceylanicum]
MWKIDLRPWRAFSFPICFIFHALPPRTIERRVLTVDSEGNVIGEKRNGGESRMAHRRVAKQISRRTQPRTRSSRPPQTLLLRRPLSRIDPHRPIPPRTPPRIDDISRRTWARTRVLSQRPNSVNFPLSKSTRIRPSLAAFTRAPLQFPPPHSTRRIVDNTMRAITLPLPIEPPRWTSRPVIRFSRPPTNNILTAHDRILPRPRIGTVGAIAAQRPFEPSEADIEQAVIKAILESSTIASRRRPGLRRPNLRPTPALSGFPHSHVTQMGFSTPIVSSTAQREDHFTRPFVASFTTANPRFSGAHSEDNIETEAIIPVFTTTPIPVARLEKTLTATSSLPTSPGRRISLVFGREQISRQRSRSRGLHKHSSFSSSFSHSGTANVNRTRFTTETPFFRKHLSTSVKVTETPSTIVFHTQLSTSIETTQTSTSVTPSTTTFNPPREETSRLALITPISTFPTVAETSRTAFTELTTPSALTTETADLQPLRTTFSTSAIPDSEESQSSTTPFITVHLPVVPLTTQTTTDATSTTATEELMDSESQELSREDSSLEKTTERPLRPDDKSRESTVEGTTATTVSLEQTRGPPAPPPVVNSQADNQTTASELKEELNKNVIEGEQLTVLPPSPLPPTTTQSIQEIGAPGAEPPSDSVVAELNNADNFMEVARRLQLIRDNFALKRHRRSGEDSFTDRGQS